MNSESLKKGTGYRINFGAEIMQDRAKLRQHKHQEKDQHADRSEQQERRIAQRIGDFASQRFSAAAIVGQNLQNFFKRSRDLADPYQRHIHRWKQGRVVRRARRQNFRLQEYSIE